MVCLVMALLMAFLKNALMCIKKFKLINHDCLPISMLLYIMLAYLMLLAALSNAVSSSSSRKVQLQKSEDKRSA